MPKHVFVHTRSGGVSTNSCVSHAARPSVGFGGSGTSRIGRTGRQDGIEGFHEFSNQRGVFVRVEIDIIDAFHQPAKAAMPVQAAPGG